MEALEIKFLITAIKKKKKVDGWKNRMGTAEEQINGLGDGTDEVPEKRWKEWEELGTWKTIV